MAFAPPPADSPSLGRRIDRSREASDFLKALAHEGRLTILRRLVEGECSVTDLERLLVQRQSTVSQQLARLRRDGLVTPRREGKTVYYRLADARARRLVGAVLRSLEAAHPAE